MTRRHLPFGLGTLAAACAAVAVTASLALAAVLAVGDEVPDLAYRTADGKDAKLSAHSGRTVVLFFYGTWSKRTPGDAAKAAGLLTGREKQALTVLGVARDATAEDTKKYAEEQKFTFPQACDPKAELYGRFAEKGLPYVVVIDGDRKLRWSGAGAPGADVETVLTEILGKAETKDAGGAK